MYLREQTDSNFQSSVYIGNSVAKRNDFPHLRNPNSGIMICFGVNGYWMDDWIDTILGFLCNFFCLKLLATFSFSFIKIHTIIIDSNRISNNRLLNFKEHFVLYNRFSDFANLKCDIKLSNSTTTTAIPTQPVG